MKSLICVIHGREALPVRAIPYVAGRTFLSPDEVAKQLARKIGPPFSRLQNTTAFHVARDLPVNVLPREWDEIIAQFEALEARLKRVQPSDAEGYAEWLEQATPLLPAAVFVWRDEFEKDFHQDRENISSAVWRDGDAVLNFSPMLSEPLREMIFEGVPWQSASLQSALAAPKAEEFTVPGIHGTSTMNRAAYEEYQTQRADRLSNGRYRLEEAAMQINQETGVRERAENMLSKLMQAAKSGALPVYGPGENARYLYGTGHAQRVRDFYEEAYWNDLNAWLDAFDSRIEYRFPAPGGASPIPQPDAVRKADSASRQPIPRQRFQENEIMRVMVELEYVALALPKPPSGKSGVKAGVRGKLSFSRSIFDKAWERLQVDGRIKYKD